MAATKDVRGIRFKELVEKKYLINPRVNSRIIECGMPLNLDSYTKCNFGCLYCFAQTSKMNNCLTDKDDLDFKSVNVKDLIPALHGNPKSARAKIMYMHFYKNKFPIHYGGMTDPFSPFESIHNVTYQCLEALAEVQYPIVICFKGDAVLNKNFMKLLAKHAGKAPFVFQVSITTGDSALSELVEPGAPSTDRRLFIAKQMSEMGYFVSMRLRPFILGVTDINLDSLLERAVNAGIGGISTEFLTYDVRAPKTMKRRMDLLGKIMGIDNMQSYFSELSPSERGYACARLNRHVKERHIKKLYKFCIDHKMNLGIGDPDFKELNRTGACCGYSEKWATDHKFHYTPHQMTRALRDARRAFHTTGKDQFLYFDKVWGDASYLDEPELVDDHLNVRNRTAAERNLLTFRLMLEEQWNNLDSPANVRNHYHGKVLPVGTDSNGNLVYKYQEMEYEKRWKEEGIDLTL